MLARECGWTKGYIEDNLTYAQIVRYNEIILKQKKQDVLVNTISIFKATAYAFGGINKDAFSDFIRMLSSEDKPVSSLKDLKNVKSIIVEEK